MKTALVKQALDVFGPWSGVLWKDTTALELFEIWPGKAVYWELTCVLQADWYIVPPIIVGDYARDAVTSHPRRAEIMRRYTGNITDARSIPFDEYDLVISFDAILSPQAGSRTVFAYYAQEHWDRLYKASVRKPQPGYDLFLDHMMEASATLHSLPQAVSFPYLHNTELVRSHFPLAKRESVWVDWRTLMTLAMKGIRDGWCPEAEAAGERLQELLGLPVAHRGGSHKEIYSISDPPAWGDARCYLQDLSRCRFYVAVGNISGAGQGLGEAAALGCLCIGQSDKVYHRLICHPACLCKDIAEMPGRLRALRASADLQAEVLSCQDDALRKHFERGPLNLLQEAVQMKTASPRSARSVSV